MQLFNKFVLAFVVFASSVVTKPAVANVDKAALTCKNDGEIEGNVGMCHILKSIGMLSLEECKKEGGAVYYCFAGDHGTCISVNELPTGTTGGECFEPPAE